MNLKGKKIVITGANGFVGSNAVHYFHKLGANVTAIISPRSTTQTITKQLGEIEKNIKIKKLDLLSPSDAMKAVEKQDIVLHFAAIDGNAEFKKKYSAEIFSKNIRMNLNMLEAAAGNSVKAFLLMSSTDIYSPSTRLLTENSPINISLHKDIDGYKLAKWSSELAAKEFNKQYGLQSIIVRASNLYGPRDEFNNVKRMRVIPSIIKKIYETDEPISIWGDKKQQRSFLYINDFLFICKKLIENNIYLIPINIASQQNISLEDLAKKMISITKKKKRIITNKNFIANTSTKKFNLSLLRKKFPNFIEMDFNKGLEETINYYKKIKQK